MVSDVTAVWPVALAVLLLALTFHTSLRDLLLHPLVDSAPSTHHATTRLAFRSRVLFAPPMHIPVMCKDLFLVLFWGRPRHDLSCASSLPAMYADHLHTLREAAGARPSEVRRRRGARAVHLDAPGVAAAARPSISALALAPNIYTHSSHDSCTPVCDFGQVCC